jgi:hypothetical protein
MTLRNRIRNLLLHGRSPVNREVRNAVWNAETSLVLLYLDTDEDRTTVARATSRGGALRRDTRWIFARSATMC